MNNRMAAIESGYLSGLSNLLQQDYRGVNIAAYALATAGLAVSIHRIRPVSKFSKASQIPSQFLKRHEPLRGRCAGVAHAPLRVLVDHRAPIYLPLWHSSKPPLPVKLWGVEIASGNAVSWLECVARGQQVTLKPIARDNDNLISNVLLHLPQAKTKTLETVDVGQKLVELGFAKTSLPQNIKKNSIESKLAPALLSAEKRAKIHRNGIWLDTLPPLPIYVIYWRKGLQVLTWLILLTGNKLVEILKVASKSALGGFKHLRLLRSTKEVQAS